MGFVASFLGLCFAAFVMIIAFASPYTSFPQKSSEINFSKSNQQTQGLPYNYAWKFKKLTIDYGVVDYKAVVTVEFPENDTEINQSETIAVNHSNIRAERNAAQSGWVYFKCCKPAHSRYPFADEIVVYSNSDKDPAVILKANSKNKETGRSLFDPWNPNGLLYPFSPSNFLR